MTRRRVWYLPGSPVTFHLAALPETLEARPLPLDGLAQPGDEDGALVVDLDADPTEAVDAAVRRFALPVVALLAPGTAEAPPLIAHSHLVKPVPAFALATALENACAHAQLQREQAATRRQLEELNAIGVRLTAERDADALLELILTKARAITRSDAGSIYLVEEPEGEAPRLRFKLAQNDSVRVPFIEFTLPIGEESIAGYVALTAEAVLVDDAYNVPQGYRFRINRDFDAQIG